MGLNIWNRHTRSESLNTSGNFRISLEKVGMLCLITPLSVWSLFLIGWTRSLHFNTNQALFEFNAAQTLWCRPRPRRNTYQHAIGIPISWHIDYVLHSRETGFLILTTLSSAHNNYSLAVTEKEKSWIKWNQICIKDHVLFSTCMGNGPVFGLWAASAEQQRCRLNGCHCARIAVIWYRTEMRSKYKNDPGVFGVGYAKRTHDPFKYKIQCMLLRLLCSWVKRAGATLQLRTRRKEWNSLSVHPVLDSVLALHLNSHVRDCHPETPPLPSLPTYLLNFNEPR